MISVIYSWGKNYVKQLPPVYAGQDLIQATSLLSGLLAILPNSSFISIFWWTKIMQENIGNTADVWFFDQSTIDDFPNSYTYMYISEKYFQNWPNIPHQHLDNLKLPLPYHYFFTFVLFKIWPRLGEFMILFNKDQLNFLVWITLLWPLYNNNTNSFLSVFTFGSPKMP